MEPRALADRGSTKGSGGRAGNSGERLDEKPEDRWVSGLTLQLYIICVIGHNVSGITAMIGMLWDLSMVLGAI